MEVTIPDFDLQTIAESGQCFRMRKAGNGAYSVVSQNRHVMIRPVGKEVFEFSCPEKEFPFWEGYFDLKTDYGAFYADIDPNDAFLHKAMTYSTGMRILRQDPWEVLVSFVISQRKSLPAIQKAVEALCLCSGEPIETVLGTQNAFPTPGKLSNLSQPELRACTVGYRDKYLSALSGKVASGEFSLSEIARLDDETAKKRLTGLFGVGSKVADCILLFGYHRMGAFPVDVWIGRVVQNEYKGSFPAERYPGFAGFLQQCMFYYAKSKEYGFAHRNKGTG